MHLSFENYSRLEISKASYFRDNFHTKDKIGIQYSEKGSNKNIFDLNELTSNFGASKF